jgi:hypothetical protein
VRRLVLIVAGALALAGCTSSSPSQPAPITIVHPTTKTRTQHVPGKKFTPPPATTVAPRPAGSKLPKGEVDRSCPYIKGGLDSEPTSGPNVAKREGDRVGRITVLTKLHPMGCRFYFSYSPNEAVADILPRTFKTHLAARAAMIGTATAGAQAETYKNFVKGVTGIRYRTRFYGPDGKQDWAFVFAKGKVMVVVHTQQTNASLNAQAIAEAIVGKF